MTVLADLFRRHVAQTSDSPMGVEVVRAEGSRVFDAQGRDFIDLLAGMGVANVGHRHPEVVAAIREQSDRYLHAMVYGEYVQAPQVLLAEQLAALLPPTLSVVYFTNSGTEAIEGALKTARKKTGRRRFVAFEGGFHGDTFGAVSVGGNPLYREPFQPLLPDVVHLPFGEIDSLDAVDETTAAVVVEPIQVEGGVRIPDQAFLEALRKRSSEVGALLVFDEVVTGFGRCGSLFAFERFDVVPDILVLAKALGGGMPLGALVASPEILETLSSDPPLAHVTTFGGHPVSCVAGRAALEVLLRERLWEQAERTGETLQRELRELPWNGHLVEVRGRGLLIGLELDDAGFTSRFARRCLDNGVVLNWTLHRDRVVRLAPPLTIGSEDVREAVERVRRAIP